MAEETLPRQQLTDHHGTDSTATYSPDAPHRGEENFGGDNNETGEVTEGATVARQEIEESTTAEVTEKDAVEHDCDVTEEPAVERAGEKEEEESGIGSLGRGRPNRC